MPRKKATRGNCVYCGKEYTRWGMTRHLQTCAVRAGTFETDAKRPGRAQEICHLLVEDVWYSNYWLHLEISGRATLDELDEYLRVIWLECCSHLSQFLINEIYYEREPQEEWSIGETESTNAPIGSVFRPGTIAEYEYDFGTTTELKISAQTVRSGKWGGKPIRLMARNHPPEMRCMVCGQQAEWICAECLWEGKDCFLCVQHLDKHEHDDEMTLPAVNSPRIGMCAYDGPAEPPY